MQATTYGAGGDATAPTKPKATAVAATATVAEANPVTSKVDGSTACGPPMTTDAIDEGSPPRSDQRRAASVRSSMPPRVDPSPPQINVDHRQR